MPPYHPFFLNSMTDPMDLIRAMRILGLLDNAEEPFAQQSNNGTVIEGEFTVVAPTKALPAPEE